MVTKDRVGGALVIVAAVVGLVLVFTGEGAEGSDDDAAPGTSQVEQAPGQDADRDGDDPSPVPGPVQPGPGSPGQSGQPDRPAAPGEPAQPDADGDDG